jgi:hypothetical protein
VVAQGFPTAARLIGVHREWGIDDLIAAKVEMPVSEWPTFLAKTPIERDRFSPGEQGLLGPDDGFWDPHQAKVLRTAQTLLPGGRTLNIGYDDTAPDVRSQPNVGLQLCGGAWPEVVVGTGRA